MVQICSPALPEQCIRLRIVLGLSCNPRGMVRISSEGKITLKYFWGVWSKDFFGRKILAIIFWVGWFMACKFGIRCGSRKFLGFSLKPKWFYVLFFYFLFWGGRLIFAPIRKSLLLDNRSKRPGGKTSKRGFLSEKKSVNQNITAENAIKTSHTSKHSPSRISNFKFCPSLIPKVRKKLINDIVNINSDYSQCAQQTFKPPIFGKHLW